MSRHTDSNELCANTYNWYVTTRSLLDLTLSRADNIHRVRSGAKVGAQRAPTRRRRDVSRRRRRPATGHREMEVGAHDPAVVRVTRARPDRDGWAQALTRGLIK